MSSQNCVTHLIYRSTYLNWKSVIILSCVLSSVPTFLLLNKFRNLFSAKTTASKSLPVTTVTATTVTDSKSLPVTTVSASKSFPVTAETASKLPVNPETETPGK